MFGRRFFCSLFVVVLLFVSGDVFAQSGTSSALSGTVVDPTGAAVSGAVVEATEVNTHAMRSVRTDVAGHYLFSQLNPGTYQVSISSSGFARVTSEPTAVSVGRNIALNFTLKVSSQSQTVEVTAQQGLLALDNPNTTTTLEAKTIKSLPNPGQDLTYLAQFAEGALMNTAGSSNDAKAAGGYGNVEFNGLPATSNGYILDGYDTNDPWLGLNIGLSTNLVIGLDAVEQATINTNSFAVDQGRYAVAQVNYFTKSGTNQFHGDAYELWNGSLLNAENYFLHANDTPGNVARKPRSVVNEFGVSVGGPIRRDKLFFFGHYEGIRIALPLVSPLTLPPPAFQAYVLGQLASSNPAEVPFYRTMFSLLPNASGTPVPIIGCPLENGNGCANQRQASLNNSDSENLIVAKIDHTLSKQDTLWYRFQQDTGLQAAYTDPVNPIFNAYSPQPQRTLVLGYTHVFGPNLVNQFNPGASWYSSIFEPNNYAAVQQQWPMVLVAGSSAVPFTTIGGNDNTYPQGRKVTQWQVNDNLTWTVGPHTLKFGINTRRLDVSDYDLGEGTVPTVTYNNLAEFIDGQAYTAAQTFPISLKERVALGNLEFYGMDTYKPSSKATITYGIRASWNTNETNQQGLFARPAGSFLDMNHSTEQPLNQAIQYRGAQRIWRVLRHHSGSNCRPCRGQSAVRSNVRWRTRGSGRRQPHSAWRAEQRGGRDRGSEHTVPVALRLGRRSMRRGCSGRGNLSASREPEHLSRRTTQDAVLLPVQPRPGEADGPARRSARGLRRHKGDARAIPGATQRLSDGLPRMLRSLSVSTAHRSALRQRY